MGTMANQLLGHAMFPKSGTVQLDLLATTN
jgi:hypothetical protein